jgi:galactonate dehydratase
MAPTQRNYTNGMISSKGEQTGVETVAAVREAVGPEVQIMIDCHGLYNVATASRIGKRLAEYDIWWLEEPVPPESYQALRQVKENTGVPICVGERLYTRFEFIPIFENRLAEFIMPDVCWTGGISELRKIANMAEAYYVPISPHNVQSSLQILAGAHTMSTIPNFYRLEFNSSNMERYNGILDTPLDIRDGELYLSDKPGLGVDLDMDYIERYTVEGWEL